MNWTLLANSALVAGCTTIVTLLLGRFAALWVCGLQQRGRGVVTALAIVAVMLPPFLVTNCWLHLLGHTGIWRGWLPLNIFSLPGAVLILSLMLWPVPMLLISAAWRRVDSSLLEADPMLRGFSLFRLLLEPMAGPAIQQSALITLILAFTNFAVPAILQVKVFPSDVWVGFNTTFDYRAAALNSWPMVVVPLLLIWLLRRETIIWPAKRHSSSAVFRQQSAWLWYVAAFVGTVVLLLSVALPLSQILFSQQTWRHFLPAVAAGAPAMVHSFVFAAGAATCVAVISLLTWRFAFTGAMWIAFSIPGVLLGIALIWLLNRGPFTAFYQSIGMVIVAFAIRYIAPALTITKHAMRATDRDLNDVAVMEGATPWQVFRRVQWPQVMLPVGAAWYLCYLLCLWDVETLIFIVPPGRETVALRIFNLLHYGHNSQVNALCLLLLGAAVLPLLGFAALRMWKPRWSATVVGLLALPLVLGCSASTGKSSANRAPIDSEIFSHVEVIGSRGTGAGQFNKPRSLTLDKNDNLFVVDMTGRVQKFSPEGVFLLSWQMPQTDLGRPKGMGTDSHGNIIVIEPHYSRVNHFAPDGQPQRQWGVHGTNDGQLAFPRAVAINSRGEMLFSEYTITERIQRFSPAAEFLSGFGAIGDKPGEFNRAEGVAIDAHDRLYVADSCNHRVQVFSPEGKFLRSHGQAGSGRGDLSYPYDVRIDSMGLEFVCEFGNSRVQVFDEQGRTVEILGGAGSAPGQMANPWSIALDSRGNLYVADSQNHRVQRFVRRTATQLAAKGKGA